MLRQCVIVVICGLCILPLNARLCEEVRVFNTVSEFEPNLRGCTVIIGFLKIVMEKAKIHEYENISFPELTEIRGFLLLYRVYGLTSLGKLFPNLSVIRGTTLLTDYSFVLRDVPHLQEISQKLPMDQTEKKLRHTAVDLFEESKALKRDIIKYAKGSAENLGTEKTDIINKLENLKVIVEDSKTELQNYFQFPGHKNDTYNGDSLFHEMSDQEIECVVLTAQSEAIDICNKMGIKECNIFAMNILPVDLDSLNCVESLDCETDLETDCQLEESISFSETLKLKDYSHDNKGNDVDFVNGPFLKGLLENGSAKTVKKTSLCWLFSKNSAKLSSDRLTRFTLQVSNEKLKLKPVKTFKTP
ncbi:hypothetical protein FQR65_LT11633 [Abscondita terminalis]|nr:hypothetical protein FQR65_LT11633 [Abscondita terminalis]